MSKEVTRANKKRLSEYQKKLMILFFSYYLFVKPFKQSVIQGPQGSPS